MAWFSKVSIEWSRCKQPKVVSFYTLPLSIRSNVKKKKKKKKGWASEAYVESLEVLSGSVKGVVVELNELLCWLRITVLDLDGS